MPKSKPPRLPSAPWDHGATGPANRVGLVEEPATEIDPETGRERPNPNRVTRMRRTDWVAVYSRKGWLTGRQLMTARALQDAAEGARNQDPLAAFGRKVDRDTGCPDPLAVAYDRRRTFHAMWPLVPGYAKPVIEHVVINGHSLGTMPGAHRSSPAIRRHLERMCRGLDALADACGKPR